MSGRGRVLRGPGLAVLGATLWMAGAAEARACGSCYGLADGPMIDAARLGIWFMLGTTILVQGGFAAFFVYLHRRASRAARPAPPPMPDPAGGSQ
jgi:hypothetical protein